MTSTLHTERLVLEPYIQMDEAGFVALFQDPRVSQWSSWGSGLGTGLEDVIVAYGFNTIGLTEVHATVTAANEASLSLLRKIGFEPARDIEEDDGSIRVLTRRMGCR